MSIVSNRRSLNSIEPSKSIIEDLEILAFESEEQLNLYTIWHEALVDNRRELNAENERERQIIRNEINRRTRQLISLAGEEDLKRKNKKSSSETNLKEPTKRQPANATSTSKTNVLDAGRRTAAQLLASSSVNFRPSRTSISISTPGVPFRPSSRSNQSSAQVTSRGQGQVPLPEGLAILNSSQMNTLPSGKQIMKYKLTKLYNKYRGRQLRRNLVSDKQTNAKIELEISKSYLNSWLAYNALRALRLPEPSYQALSTTTTNNSKILTPITQLSANPSTSQLSSESPKKGKSSSKKQQSSKSSLVAGQAQPSLAASSQSLSSSSQQPVQKPPMHIVYLDPGNIITYSNKINPQQIAEYRQKSHLLPSSATSKKSSAASYDVYEIMEVLANTNKTNVTITRNSSRPSQANKSANNSASVYSHSVNSNTPGIVSTQLHLQAKTYLDLMSKFYAEEANRLAEQRKALDSEPSHEEIISRYLNTSQVAFKTRDAPTQNIDSCGNSNVEEMDDVDLNNGEHDADPEDEIERLEKDIFMMLDHNVTNS